MMGDRPKLLLVDDHALMAEGLRAILEPEYQVVDVVRDGGEVLGAVELHRPDVVLLDLSLPGRSGLEVSADLRRLYPEVRVVIVTMHADPVYADEALKTGAAGYVLKLARAEELRFAITEALAGRQYVTPLLAEAAGAASRIVPSDAGGVLALTDRQREVLRLIAKGRSTIEIAAALGVSEKAVEFHRGRIRRTLGLTSTAALIRYAMAEGLV